MFRIRTLQAHDLLPQAGYLFLVPTLFVGSFLLEPTIFLQLAFHVFGRCQWKGWDVRASLAYRYDNRPPT